MDVFDHTYWLAKLIHFGSGIQPEKYSDQYIQYLAKAWAGQPLTKLHHMVMQREKEFLSKSKIKAQNEKR